MTTKQQYVTWFIAYLAAVGLILFLNVRFFSESWLRFPLLLLPIIPVLFMFRALFQMIFLEEDELTQKIHLISFAITLAGISIITLTYGFLEVEGLPQMPMLLIFPLICLIFAITHPIVTRWYS